MYVNAVLSAKFETITVLTDNFSLTYAVKWLLFFSGFLKAILAKENKNSRIVWTID